jgi:hypothetical protein
VECFRLVQEIVVEKRIGTSSELLLEGFKGRLGGQPIFGLLKTADSRWHRGCASCKTKGMAILVTLRWPEMGRYYPLQPESTTVGPTD